MISGSFHCQGRGEYRASGGGVGMPSMILLCGSFWELHRLTREDWEKRMEKKRIEFHSAGIYGGLLISEKVLGIEQRR